MATALLVSRSLAASTAPPLDSDLRMGFIVGSSLPSTMMKLTRPLIKSPDIKILPRFGITNVSVRPPKKPCAMRLASHSPLRAYCDGNHHNAIDTWRESPALTKGGRRRSNFLPGKLSGPRTATRRQLWKAAQNELRSPKEQASPSSRVEAKTLRFIYRLGRDHEQ